MSEEKRSGQPEQEEKPKPLVPIEERQVDFYGDNITATLVKLDEEALPEVYVPIRPICDYLGVSWVGQRERIVRDPVLSEVLRGVRVTRTPGLGGGTQEMLCLPLEFLPGWLFGVQANRVKAELRDKIIRYQRECFKVLSRAFSSETTDLVANIGFEVEAEELEEDIFAPPVRPPTPAELEREARFEAAMQELARIREMGVTIVQMSEQQMELERQLHANITKTDENTQRLDQASRLFGRLQKRVNVLEGRLNPKGLITQEQSVQVSTMVKSLAEYLTGRDAANKELPAGGQRPNRYQSIFAELYRRFGVPNYQVIPLDRYPKVLKFLDDWKKAADLGQEELFLQGQLF